MIPPQLIDANGRPLILGNELARGGEGGVYLIPTDAASVAKVYLHPPSDQTFEKLTAMTRTANPALLGVAAWPKELLFDARTRRVAGFTMPRLVNCKPVQQLYNTTQRESLFPKAGWRFQVHAAANLAAAFDEVHKCGCLIGDVNESNVQVSTQALVTLIDCDSFQVRDGNKNYLCEVGKPPYTPPELQGKHFRGLVRTENHDRFGLAVLIFQLLHVGNSPFRGLYSGQGDLASEDYISQYLFAHGPHAATWQMSPLPSMPTHDNIPSDLFQLFRGAFERGSEKGNRPTAHDWVRGLRVLQPKIIDCSNDDGHNYWSGLSECPWCRFAKQGMEYYRGAASGTVTFTIGDPKLQDAIRRLKAVEQFHYPFPIDTYRSPNQPVGRTLPAEIESQRAARDAAVVLPPQPDDSLRREFRTTAFALGGVLALGCVIVPTAFLLWQLLPIGLFIIAIFGVWLAYHANFSPYASEKKRLKAIIESQLQMKRAAKREFNRLVRVEMERRTQRLRKAEKEIAHVNKLWEQIQDSYQQRRAVLDSLIRAAIQKSLELPKVMRAELQILTAQAENKARLRHLRLHPIADADIPGIGPGRINALALKKVTSAADIDAASILNIPGFGPGLTQKLLDWKADVLKAFQFNPATAVSAAEQKAMMADFKNRERALAVEIDTQLRDLEGLSQSCRGDLEKVTPQLQQAFLIAEQAKADFQLIDVR